jgi:hypothetical protein
MWNSNEAPSLISFQGAGCVPSSGGKTGKLRIQQVFHGLIDGKADSTNVKMNNCADGKQRKKCIGVDYCAGVHFLTEINHA